MNNSFIDLSGQRFGRLVAKKVSSEKRNSRSKLWECECDCGVIVVVQSCSLRRLATRSCGCLLREQAKKTNTTHGHSYDRVYRIRLGMLQRCYNQNDPWFKYYGAKGITVCDEWKNDPMKFVEWALANGYASKLTIERKDGDLGYSPENCTWIPKGDQVRNPKTRAAITEGVKRYYAERRKASFAGIGAA